jgi:cobalt-zinc-cadmium efflux system outer membrane protein
MQGDFMFRTVLCAALAAALVPSGAGAQSLRLTEADALARLSPESPRVRAIRSAVDLARVDVLEAGRWPNPRLAVNREAVAGVTEYMTMVSQPLPVTGRRGLDVQAASALVSASASRAEEDVRRLRADLRLAFAGLVAAQASERELTAARDRLRELAGVLARREAEGAAAGFDRLRAEREVFDLEADLAIASTERFRAQAMLSSFFAGGPDPSALFAVAPAAALAVPVPALDALIEQAASIRGELTALQHEIDAARLSARAADRRLVPEPEVLAGAKTSSARGGDLGSVLSLQASLPLFDRARPERALAAAREARAQAQADAFRAVLRGEVAALRDAVLQRRAASDRYRANAVSSAAEIERIAQVSYDAGEHGILELLDAYRVGASARTRQAALDLAVRLAEIELEFATGWELPS